jgi:hypothetical protein
MNNELERMWKEGLGIAYCSNFEELSRNCTGGTEENYEILG